MVAIMTGYRGDGKKRMGLVVPSRWPHAGLITVQCAERSVIRSYRPELCDNLIFFNWYWVARLIFMVGV